MKIFRVFSDALTRQNIPSGLDVYFYVYLDNCIKEKANDPTWRSLRGKIRPDMVKPRRSPADFKAELLPGTPRPKATKQQSRTDSTDNTGAANTAVLDEIKTGNTQDTSTQSTASENKTVTELSRIVVPAIPANAGLIDDHQEGLRDSQIDSSVNLQF
jgi:hypothetical protein